MLFISVHAILSEYDLCLKTFRAQLNKIIHLLQEQSTSYALVYLYFTSKWMTAKMLSHWRQHKFSRDILYKTETPTYTLVGSSGRLFSMKEYLGNLYFCFSYNFILVTLWLYSQYIARFCCVAFYIFTVCQHFGALFWGWFPHDMKNYPNVLIQPFRASLSFCQLLIGGFVLSVKLPCWSLPRFPFLHGMKSLRIGILTLVFTAFRKQHWWTTQILYTKEET